MDTETLKSRLISEGKASVLSNETKDYAIRGGLAGFDLCQALHTQEDFTRVLAERNQAENHLFDLVHEGKAKIESYWEYRAGTLQIHYVFERMQVVWSASVLSLSAVRDVAEIMAEWRKAMCN